MNKEKILNFDSNVDYTTVLNGFEGPLDLLLYLIRCNEIQIRDVFVSQVMEQFLDYMKGLPYLDADKASEYLVIASTILAIKAKSLVPADDAEYDDGPADDDDDGDEREQLIRALEEYRLIKEETPKLKEMETVGYFFKAPDRGVGKTRIVYKDFNLDGLVKAITDLMLRLETQKAAGNIKEIPKDTFTVSDKVYYIRDVLRERNSVQFEDLLSEGYSKSEIITTFQALLELLKHQYLCTKQQGTFETIYITLNPDRSEDDYFGDIDEYN